MDKIYAVIHISFYDFTIVAEETDLTIDDVPENEVFSITDFEEFRITFHNWTGRIVDFVEYVKSWKEKH